MDSTFLEQFSDAQREALFGLVTEVLEAIDGKYRIGLKDSRVTDKVAFEWINDGVRDAENAVAEVLILAGFPLQKQDAKSVSP